MTTKFEQLIEYVINDEQAKARELFHDIVVEKSRQIYETMMQDEDLEEGEMGGSKAADLIDDVEADEQDDMAMEADGDDEEAPEDSEEEIDVSMDMDDADDDMDDMGDEGELEDRVVDLEDKLDELMAEFESLMSDGAGSEEEIDMEVGDDMGDDMGMSDEEVIDDELETEGMMESVSLKAAPTPVKTESGAQTRSPVAANAGGKGPIGNTVKPVKTGGDQGGHHDSAAYKNTVKELRGDLQNEAGSNMKGLKPAPKPTMSQASGVNTKSVVSKG